jgi:hypothetical protein
MNTLSANEVGQKEEKYCHFCKRKNCLPLEAGMNTEIVLQLVDGVCVTFVQTVEAVRLVVD